MNKVVKFPEHNNSLLLARELVRQDSQLEDLNMKLNIILGMLGVVILSLIIITVKIF